MTGQAYIFQKSAKRYADPTKVEQHRPVHSMAPSTCEACHHLIGHDGLSDPVHNVSGPCRDCGKLVGPFHYRCEQCTTLLWAQREVERQDRMAGEPVRPADDSEEEAMSPVEQDEHREGSNPLYREAKAYAAAYQGNFEFMVAGPLGIRGPLSSKMVESILKCKAAEVRRTEERKSNQTGRDLNVLPEGRTAAAVDNDSGGLTFLLIDRPAANSKWAGWVFVKQQQGPNEVKLGSQRPGETYSGQWANLIDKVLDDPEAAVARYGKELGICGICMRTLTNEESREQGIGPICLAKLRGN